MKRGKINGELKEIDGVTYVPYIVCELNLMTSKFVIKLLSVITIISMLITLAVVGISAYERLQYDYTATETSSEITVDGEDGVANYIGNDGDIINGENNSKENN